MDSRRIFGDQGEGVAAAYLERKAYTIIARQFRTRFGEIDLVVLDGDEIVFVEVKTRRSLAEGYPEDSVHPGKLHRMEIAAEAFLKEKAWENRPYRFDVIAIIDRGGESEIEHLIGV